MSCFLMCSEEISALSLISKIPFEVLARRNVESINERYGEDETPVEFKSEFAGELSEAQSAKLIDCYLYQCSEHPQYHYLSEFAQLRTVKSTFSYTEEEWDAASWGL